MRLFLQPSDLGGDPCTYPLDVPKSSTGLHCGLYTSSEERIYSLHICQFVFDHGDAKWCLRDVHGREALHVVSYGSCMNRQHASFM